MEANTCFSLQRMYLPGCARQIWGGQWPRTSREEWNVPRGVLAEGRGLRTKVRSLSSSNTGQGREGLRIFLEESLPLVWQDGTRQGRRQEGKHLLLRFPVGGGRATVGWATDPSEEGSRRVEGWVSVGAQGRNRLLPLCAWSSHRKVSLPKANLAKSPHLLFLPTI